MSYKDKDSNTTTIERNTPSLLDLLEKHEEQNKTAEKEIERFDNSHNVEKLNKVYDEIDRAAIREEVEASEKKYKKKDFKGLDNPFFGDSEAIEKMRRTTYNDIISTPKETPTLEIRAYSKNVGAKKEKLTNRMKLWIITGSACFVLLAGMVLVNVFSYGKIERDIAALESNITQQEAELDALNGKVESEGTNIPEGMKDLGAGQKVDITPVNPTNIETGDNFFNQIAKFIAYLFGR